MYHTKLKRKAKNKNPSQEVCNNTTLGSFFKKGQKIMANVNIFGFNAPVEGFETMDMRKSKEGVASVFNPGGADAVSTVSPTLLKALQSFARIKINSRPGAIGLGTDRVSAEYQTGADEYDVVVYTPSSGSVLASHIDTLSGGSIAYKLGKGNRLGTAIMFSLIPNLMLDAEFQDCYKNIELDLLCDKFADIADQAEFEKNLHTLSDNAYRRISENSSVPSAVLLKIPKTGNLVTIKNSAISAGTYTPDSVYVGDFNVLTTVKAKSTNTKTTISAKDFDGMYALDSSRVYTEEEKKLIPSIPDYYVVSDEAVEIALHAKATLGKKNSMKNFLLRGPAGTGKTMDAKAISSALGLPYVLFTCSTNTEIFDFIGQMLPCTGTKSTLTPSDIVYDPEGSYEELTGKTAPEDIDVAEVMELFMANQQSDKGFKYVETDLIKALKYGWCIEIQEPTVISQPGVLVGLNSLLEQEGLITLPTGETIKRHPHAVVIVTTNVDYEGCRGLNQSVVSRMNLCLDKPLPDNETIVKRIMNKTSYNDKDYIEGMVDIVSQINEYCIANDITDGVCGVRELLDWAESVSITKNPFKSAIHTIISKVTSDKEERDAIVSSFFEPSIFAPFM